jgi:broad specificity phosphatase PhoE
MAIPNYLVNAFQHVPADRPVNVLIRHAPRFPITNESEVITAQLTEEGEELARLFGDWLNQRFSLGTIHSSPINRCIETGRFLSIGAGNYTTVVSDSVLAHPHENREFDLMGDYLKSGDWSQRILETAKRMFPEGNKPEMNFLITHDTVIALMIGYWLGIDLRPEEHWPRFLEPFFFWHENQDRIIYFRGIKTTLKPKNKVL